MVVECAKPLATAARDSLLVLLPSSYHEYLTTAKEQLLIVQLHLQPLLTKLPKTESNFIFSGEI